MVCWPLVRPQQRRQQVVVVAQVAQVAPLLPRPLAVLAAQQVEPAVQPRLPPQVVLADLRRPRQPEAPAELEEPLLVAPVGPPRSASQVVAQVALRRPLRSRRHG